MKICYLIPKLEIGGAETQLYYLVKEMSKQHDIIVCPYYEGGALWEKYCSVPNIRVISLKRKNKYDIIGTLFRLGSVLIKNKVEILHAYLESGPTIGFWAAYFSGIMVRIFSFRRSKVDFESLTTKLFVFTDVISSNLLGTMVIANSESGKQQAIKEGYKKSRLNVIANGFYLSEADNGTKPLEIRNDFGIEASERVVSIIARIDPLKDHKTFIDGAKLVLQKVSGVKFLIVGFGNEQLVGEIKDYVLNLGLQKSIIFTGQRKDVAAILSVTDIVCLTSTSEAFPNTVAEGMLAGKVVIATDVGDMRRIIDDGVNGYIIPTKNPKMLAEKILFLFDNPAIVSKMGEKGREKVIKHFSMEMMVSKTIETYSGLLSGAKL